MKKLLVVLFIFAIAVAAFGNGQREQADADGPKEYDFFIGYEKDDYPNDGTIFGDWLEEQTNVRINWEFIVGDLEQKVGLIAASGDYPDAIHPRNETQILLDANALIPLNDLIDEYGPNIKDMYGERGLAQIAVDDGNVYWFPQQMPYGDFYRNPNAGHGVYVQAAVLEAWDYQIPEDLDQMADWLIEYAEENPTINGHETIAWTGQYDTWRWFGISNIPHILSGHPNDGSVNVDWENGRWVVNEYRGSQDEYDSMKILNEIHLAGLFDTETFVMSYDQYIAKLSQGNILAFYDQDWNFQQAQDLLLDQDEDRWYVAIPVMLEGYEPDIINPPTPQVSEGIGISVDAEDPEGLMQYFNVLASREAQLLRYWGREGVDYEVREDGVFYRTEEQIEQWRDRDWREKTYGAYYWDTFLRIEAGSVLWDGLNNADPGYQPNVYRDSLRPQQVEVLEELGISAWSDLFPPPNMDRTAYFPAWTITIPPDSDISVTNTRIDDEIRRRYLPLLIMAEDGEYDEIWDDYMDQLDAIPQDDWDARLQFFQDAIDNRVEDAGGY
ncbi:MAG: extracellular solute-binding protein [Spirochaetota bacterium]